MKEKMIIWTMKVSAATRNFFQEKTGSGWVDYLGGLLLAVAGIVAVLIGVNAFLPGFIQQVFNRITSDLLS